MPFFFFSQHHSSMFGYTPLQLFHMSLSCSVLIHLFLAEYRHIIYSKIFLPSSFLFKFPLFLSIIRWSSYSCIFSFVIVFFNIFTCYILPQVQLCTGCTFVPVFVLFNFCFFNVYYQLYFPGTYFNSVYISCKSVGSLVINIISSAYLR